MTLAMGTLLIAKEELNDEDQHDAESFFRSMTKMFFANGASLWCND